MLFIFVQIVSVLAKGISFSWLLCLFDILLLFYACICVFCQYICVLYFLTSYYHKMFQAYFVYIVPHSRNQSFHQLWFLKLVNGVRNQDMDAKCASATGTWLFSGSLKLTVQGDICMYKYYYMYTSVFILRYT